VFSSTVVCGTTTLKSLLLERSWSCLDVREVWPNCLVLAAGLKRRAKEIYIPSLAPERDCLAPQVHSKQRPEGIPHQPCGQLGRGYRI
jgi:hypothetical protein